MNIIVGQEIAAETDSRYLLLELDSIRVASDRDPVKTYCLIEKITLEEIFNLKHHQDLHHKLMENYRKKNWKFCLNALEHLKGQWNRDLDSFYDSIEERIIEFQQKDPGDDWDGVINKIPG